MLGSYTGLFLGGFLLSYAHIKILRVMPILVKPHPFEVVSSKKAMLYGDLEAC